MTMSKTRTGLATRLGIALGILFFTLPGVYILTGYSITANPAAYLKPAAALQELLIPFHPLIESFSGVWTYLPHVVFFLSVLINLLLALIVRKLPLPGIRHFTYLFLFGAVLGMAVFAQAAGLIPFAENLSADPAAAVPRILFYPSAMLLHAVWLVGGFMAYLLPVYGTGVAIALLLSRAKRNSLLMRASLLYATVLAVSLLAGFFMPETLQPQLNSLLLGLMPAWLAVIISLLLLLALSEAVLRVFTQRSLLTKGAKLFPYSTSHSTENNTADPNDQEEITQT
ncbi:hypothetical protein JCM12856_32280 [Spirochaeta dissipatitropha]